MSLCIHLFIRFQRHNKLLDVLVIEGPGTVDILTHEHALHHHIKIINTIYTTHHPYLLLEVDVERLHLLLDPLLLALGTVLGVLPSRHALLCRHAQLHWGSGTCSDSNNMVVVKLHREHS